MLRWTSMNNQAILLAALWLAAVGASTAGAQQIDLSLNLLYTNLADPTSGGTFQVVAKSTDFGIAGLNVLLTDTVESSAVFHTPQGTVNGEHDAGFAVNTAFDAGDYGAYVTGQAPIASNLEPGDEEGVFYGVGTLTSGSPGDIGPIFSSLTGVTDVPWATGDVFGDPTWDTGVLMVTGQFLPDTTPGFYTNELSSGRLWATLGDSMMAGTLNMNPTITTVVRDQVVGLPDYNDDGIVDGADYTVWRDTEGMTGPGLAADGTGDMVVDELDYILWELNFGEIVSPPGGGAGSSFSGPAVPEPTSGVLLLGMTLWGLVIRRFRLFFRGMEGLLDSREKAIIDVETA